MAYEHSAANRIHSAETVSPRTRASTVQQTAPTTATAAQIRTDFIERPLSVAGPAEELPPPGFSVVAVPVMRDPLHSCQRPEGAFRLEHREARLIRPPVSRTVIAERCGRAHWPGRPRASSARSRPAV